MSGETIITLIGNATGFELRFSQQGTAIGSFSLASTPRTFDKQSNDWKDGETLWLRCTCFGQMAENLAETFGDAKSIRVIVSGKLGQRSYEDRDGNRRTSYEVIVDEIGPSLRYATAQVTRASSSGGGGAQQARPQQSSHTQQQADDPWARTPALTDEPPF